MDKNQFLRRLLAMAGLLLLFGLVAVIQLFNLQFIQGDSYVKQAARNLTTATTISAARGEILDRYGRPMVTNQTAFSMILVGSVWESEGQYELLLDLAARVRADGGELQDALPITESAPYSYTAGADESDLTALSKYIKESAATLKLTRVKEALENAEKNEQPKDEINALELVTAPEFISAMQSYLEVNRDLPMGLSESDVRTLVGLYYSMRQVGFSDQINYTMATDVSIDLIAYIKEHHKEYAGVDFETQSIRKYETPYAAHILGTVGVMWSEEWEGTEHGGPYKDKPGYNMNDSVGKSGIEEAMESYLHGTAGASSIETTLGGDTFDDQMTSSQPEPGDNVILTIDLDVQKAAEESLAAYLSGTGGGSAAVAVEVNSGEVLAMASYPTYSLENYYTEYNQVNEDSRQPHFNRATGGTYAPGSTFKVLTAIAGLEEGIITDSTYIECTGEFEYGGSTFRCRNHELPMTLSVTEAIKYSCNTFFYTVGRELTGARLEKWCERFGLGNVTGIETGDASGHAAGPTFRASMVKSGAALRDWQGGDDVNAAIGQSDNAFTPLQLACYIAAVSNHGVRYKPTLVRTVKSYDYSETVKAEKPEIAQQIQFSDETYQTVMTGMSEVTAEGGTAASIFEGYSIKVGGKTGTAETSQPGVDNGVFVAFAPFDDPQIAVCVVGEGAGHGSSVAPVVRDIFNAYFSRTDENGEQQSAKTVQPENTLVP